jgi:hypothetical protein
MDDWTDAWISNSVLWVGRKRSENGNRKIGRIDTKENGMGRFDGFDGYGLSLVKGLCAGCVKGMSGCVLYIGY